MLTHSTSYDGSWLVMAIRILGEHSVLRWGEQGEATQVETD
jgi:hypothetical protein